MKTPSMSPRSISRCAPLLVVLFSACSNSSGNDQAHDANVATAGTTGTAGTAGAAGEGTAGATAAGGTAGGTAGQGAGGSTSSGGSGGVPVSEHDAAAPDGATGEGGIVHPPFTGTVKIMVLGSSNEEGTCWRAFLWQKLRAAGVTNFDFVGRNNAGPDCGVPGYDKDSEAHGGTVVENISADTWLTTFKANPPDIILQHNGGADLLNGKPYMNVIKAYTLSVTQVRMVNPKVIYFAAQHTPQGGASNLVDVMNLNAAMVPWGAGITTPESPVVIVDLFTGIDQKTDMSDGTHLNVSGSQKVSDRFLAVLLPLFKP
jgi:acyl-CoA thioesterase-1